MVHGSSNMRPGQPVVKLAPYVIYVYIYTPVKPPHHINNGHCFLVGVREMQKPGNASIIF